MKKNNNVEIKTKKKPNSYLHLLILISILMMLSVICLFVINLYSNKIYKLSSPGNNTKNTSKVDITEEKVTSKVNTTKEDVKKSCPSSTVGSIISQDSKYYVFSELENYFICDQSNKENAKLIQNYEASIKNKDTIILTTYGDKMFIVNLAANTLNYISIDDFPDKSDYLDKEGKSDLWLFGPGEENLERFSPLGDRVIIGASNCHDCNTLIQNYVLDLKSNEITVLGTADNNVEWVDNNTVSWQEVTVRQKTQEEIQKESSSDPFTTVLLGTKTLTFR